MKEKKLYTCDICNTDYSDKLVFRREMKGRVMV